MNVRSNLKGVDRALFMVNTSILRC